MLARRTTFPVGTYETFRRDLNRLFGEFERAFGGPSLLGERPFPALNIWEDGESLYAEAEVPGLKMDDLDVFVLNNELTIKGRREFNGTGEHTYHRRERGTGEFARVLTLPVEVNPDKVEATLSHGVLTIILPKAQAAKARKITVKST